MTASSLVFLHGFSLEGGAWRAQLDAFPGSIAPDVPGFGSRQLEGEADLGTLEPLLDGTHLVGHSLGAAVAVELALRAPERIRSLTLCNPLLLGRSGNISSWPTCLARAKAGDLDGARAAWLADVIFDGAREQVRPMIERYRGGHWAGRTSTGFRVSDPLPELSKLTMPVLVVTAERDLPSFRAMAAEYARTLPRAILETLDAGHMAPCEQPQQFNALLRSFLA